MFKRTHTCGELNKSNVGNEVQLNGWINTVRLHGKIVFVDKMEPKENNQKDITNKIKSK